MLVPSKFTRLEESTLFKMRKVLIGNSQGETVQGVYRRTQGVFHDATEFLHALDVLFVLGVLTFEEETGLITYA
jgi:hypothetical protein